MLQSRITSSLLACVVALGLSLSADVAWAGLVKPLSFHSSGANVEAPMEVEVSAQRGLKDVNLFIIGEDLTIHRAEMGSFTPGRTLNYDLDLPDDFGTPKGVMLIGRMRRSVAVSMNESVAREIIDAKKTFSEVYGLRESDVLRSLRHNNLDGILNFANLAVRLTPADLNQPNLLVKFSQGTESGFVNFLTHENAPPPPPKPVPLPASGWMGLTLLAVLGGMAYARHRRSSNAQPSMLVVRSKRRR